MHEASHKPHMSRPILYSFRRCPYAMRARLALVSSGVTCELREIVLRDKAAALLEASPKGTVPVLLNGDQVIEESLEIMGWALAQNDPERLLDMPQLGHALVSRFDTDFKSALDRYKYPNRFEGADPLAARETALASLRALDAMMEGPWIFGAEPRLADIAILPFIRQFANVDRDWFDALEWSHLDQWLAHFLHSERFEAIMQKFPRWEPGDAPIAFP